MRSLIKNKKAQFGLNVHGSPIWNIYLFMIIAMIVILLFAGWIYITSLLNNIFTQVGIQNEANAAGSTLYVNMTQASEQTFGKMNDAIQSLRMVGMVYILAMIAVILISNAFVKMHPMWFFPYVLIAGLGVIFAVPISNTYLELIQSNVFEGELTNSGWAAANFIMFNLPIFVMFLGMVGGIMLLINLIRQDSNPNLEQ